MVVAIRIGNNDFMHTYEAVLKILLMAHNEGVVDLEDRVDVLNHINRLSNACYKLFQKGDGDYTQYLKLTHYNLMWSHQEIEEKIKMVGTN